MIRHLTVRVLYLIPTVLAALFLVFGLAKLTPGDPISFMLAQVAAGGGSVSSEQKAAMAKAYGLDRPFLVQYADYVRSIVTLDFGTSITENRPINAMIARSLPISVQLGGSALVLLVVLGIPLGTLAAAKSRTWVDNTIVGLSIALRAMPVFVLGPILLTVLVLWLHAMKTPFGWQGLFRPQVLLPVVVLASPSLSLVIQETRVGVLNVLRDDYIRTARAKGLSPFAVVVRHGLRNALIPVVTSLGVLMAYIITSTVFIDRLFSIPGFGNLYWQSITQLDYPVLLATTAIVTIAVSLANLVVDVLYALLDPRIRYGAKHSQT